MKKEHIRFSVPGRIIELLYCDDEFIRHIVKDKRAKEGNFPKYNTYKDENGFHMVFALAGYSYKDVNISFLMNEITISSLGIQEDSEIKDHNGDTLRRTSLQRGYIVRGIARRKFSVKYQISNLFDLDKASATMKDGILHIVIPESEKKTKEIKISLNKEEG